MKKSYISWIILVAIVAWATFTLVQNKKAVVEKVYIPSADERVYVSVQKVEKKSVGTQLNYIGTLQATETMLTSVLSGLVQKVYFSAGDFVQKGQVLAQLDDDAMRADYDAMVVKQKNDAQEYQRFLKAAELAPGSVSKNQLEQYFAKWKNSLAMEEKLKKQLEYTEVVAPYSGYITQKNIEVGSMLSPAMPFARLTNLSDMKVVLQIAENDIAFFKKGQKIRITIQEEQVMGNVIYTSPRADNAHKYEVHLSISNPNNKFKAGSYASVDIQLDNTQSAHFIVIPRSALLGSVNNPQVYVVKDDIARLTGISVRSLNEQAVVVKDASLKEGDLVVVSGQISLQDGTKVRYQ